MGVEVVSIDKNHKIIRAELPAGSEMPEHHATSDAFIIVVKGKADIIFKDKKHELHAGSHLKVPDAKKHKLEIKEDFVAYIVLGPDATIEGIPMKV